VGATEEIIKRLQVDIDKVDHYLSEHLKSHVPLISEINQHILLGGGKRLRPLLFVLCARLCGRAEEKAYYLSSIYEYLHAATLLHDDVIDNAAVRRGKPAANTLWGNSASVLVGDFLLAKSFALAVDSQSLRLLEVLSRTTTQMAEGMVLELIHSHDLQVEEEAYLQILINKTAILISAACQTGAIWAGASRAEEESLGRFGLDLGIAFQMVDDLLDYTATQKEFGKPVGNDFKEGKITLPLIQTLRTCSPEEREGIKKISRKDPFLDEDFHLLLDLIIKRGGLDYARQKALEYKNRALEGLKKFPESGTRRALLDLTEFVVERRR
jgi:octaprenyl-diphosphate synthase